MDMASQYLRSDWSTLNHNNQQELSMSKLNQYKDLNFLSEFAECRIQTNLSMVLVMIW